MRKQIELCGTDYLRSRLNGIIKPTEGIAYCVKRSNVENSCSVYVKFYVIQFGDRVCGVTLRISDHRAPSSVPVKTFMIDREAELGKKANLSFERCVRNCIGVCRRRYARMCARRATYLCDKAVIGV